MKTFLPVIYWFPYTPRLELSQDVSHNINDGLGRIHLLYVQVTAFTLFFQFFLR